MTIIKNNAKDIAQMLSHHTLNLCQRYLSAGYKEANYWVVGDIRNTKAKPKGGSCKVHLFSQNGYRAGAWHDYSTDESGDMLDLLALSVYGGDKKAACQYALKQYGNVNLVASSPSQNPDTTDDDKKRKITNARKMYKAGDNNIHQTPVKDYLESRAIEILAIPHPLQIAYLPELHHYTHGRDFMGMLAPIRNVHNDITGVHRTYLIRHKGITRKIKNKAKLCYGVIKAGFIVLRKDFFKVQPSQVYMAEGIEDALSLLSITPDIHVITCVSLSNMGSVILPHFIKEIVLVQDNDSNKKIQTQLEANKRKLCQNNPHIRLFFIKPPEKYKDFNEWLCDTHANKASQHHHDQRCHDQHHHNQNCHA